MTNEAKKAAQVYLDHNATTPVSAQVQVKLPDWSSHWGNPSSIHWTGRGPKNLMREARNSIASMLGVESLEIVFTSGGSEANNMAIQGVFNSSRERRHFIYSSVEHPSVVKTMQFLRRQGAEVDVIPVSREGRLDLNALENLLRPDTALVSVMFANNETGVIHPIRKIRKLTNSVGALLHCDAVQGLGKSHLQLKAWDVDLASFSGHKFYALKGCGVLYIKKGVHVESLIHGGGQERGRRAGTENLLAIAAFGEMARQREDFTEKINQMQKLRDFLQQLIIENIEGVEVVGANVSRIPNTLSVLIKGVDGETLLMNLDMKGFAVSTGAACSSGSPEPSPVLLAMGYSAQEAQTSLRLSLGWSNTQEEVEAFVKTLKEVVERLRSFSHGAKANYGL